MSFSCPKCILGFCTGLMLFCCILLFTYQESLLYYPNMPVRHNFNNEIGYQNPEQMNLLYQNVTLTTSDDVKIRGWFMYRNVSENSKFDN